MTDWLTNARRRITTRATFESRNIRGLYVLVASNVMICWHKAEITRSLHRRPRWSWTGNRNAADDKWAIARWTGYRRRLSIVRHWTNWETTAEIRTRARHSRKRGRAERYSPLSCAVVWCFFRRDWFLPILMCTLPSTRCLTLFHADQCCLQF